MRPHGYALLLVLVVLVLIALAFDAVVYAITAHVGDTRVSEGDRRCLDGVESVMRPLVKTVIDGDEEGTYRRFACSGFPDIAERTRAVIEAGVQRQICAAAGCLPGELPTSWLPPALPVTLTGLRVASGRSAAAGLSSSDTTSVGVAIAAARSCQQVMRSETLTITVSARDDKTGQTCSQKVDFPPAGPCEAIPFQIIAPSARCDAAVLAHLPDTAVLDFRACTAAGLTIDVSSRPGPFIIYTSASTTSVRGSPAGDVIVSASATSSATIEGNGGDDILFGTNRDTLRGGDGDDVLNSAGCVTGHSITLVGGDGNDTITAKTCGPAIQGGTGANSICESGMLRPLDTTSQALAE